METHKGETAQRFGEGAGVRKERSVAQLTLGEKGMLFGDATFFVQKPSDKLKNTELPGAAPLGPLVPRRPP